MKLDRVYAMMKALREQMYEEGRTEVKLNMEEFFSLYQMVCYMMQIRHIIQDQDS